MSPSQHDLEQTLDQSWFPYVALSGGRKRRFEPFAGLQACEAAVHAILLCYKGFVEATIEARFLRSAQAFALHLGFHLSRFSSMSSG